MKHPSQKTAAALEVAQLRARVAELETRLAERTRAERELIDSEELWHGLVESAPAVIMTADLDGKVTFINRAGVGYNVVTMTGTSLYDHVPGEQHAVLRRVIEQTVETGRPQTYELQDATNSDWWSCTMGPLHRGGQIDGLIIFCLEATERKRSEQALLQSRDELSRRVAERTEELDRLVRDLRESEERFRAIATSVPVAMSISEIDGGAILDVNGRWVDLIGLPEEQIKGRSVLEFYVDPRDRQALMDALLAEGVVRDYELQLRKIDGERIWALLSLRRLTYQGRDAALTSILDITERHRSEQSLRRERRLLQRLLELQERDRQLIAYEIHAGFVQDVVGGKMLLETIATRLKKASDPRLRELDQAIEFLARAIDEGRRMIGELRPLIIDEEGVVAAIMYLVNAEKERGGPDIRFTHDVQFERLEPMLEGAVFRIVQEALTNALRYGQSDDIAVRLAQVDDQLHIEVRDRGVGFDKTQVPEDRFGLRGIQERARLFGGRAAIHAAPGQGTRVHAVLPIVLSSERGARGAD
jgi:PAS domain S-box-containing protein